MRPSVWAQVVGPKHLGTLGPGSGPCGLIFVIRMRIKNIYIYMHIYMREREREREKKREREISLHINILLEYSVYISMYSLDLPIIS
jgi:hypothetical protein